MGGRIPLPARLSKRRIGMRWWLGITFALVGLITAAAVYLLVQDSSGRTLSKSSKELALGRTIRLTDSVSEVFPAGLTKTLEGAQAEGFTAWVVNGDGHLITAEPDTGPRLTEVPRSPAAIRQALDGERFQAD